MIQYQLLETVFLYNQNMQFSNYSRRSPFQRLGFFPWVVDKSAGFLRLNNRSVMEMSTNSYSSVKYFHFVVACSVNPKTKSR